MSQDRICPYLDNCAIETECDLGTDSGSQVSMIALESPLSANFARRGHDQDTAAIPSP